MNVDISTLDPSQVYHLITQTVIPRPIAWVLTDSGEANYNLAPFSYFAPVASSPCLLMISVGKKPDGEIKDTTRNALETGQMVIHIAPSTLADKVTASAATLPHGESEVVQNGLTLVDWPEFALPRLAECDVAFGCRVYEVQEIGDMGQSLIFAEVEHVYIAERVIKAHPTRLSISAEQMDPIARLGGGEYATLDKVFKLVRPE